MRRIIWLWISQDASDQEHESWQRFIKVNMSVSKNVRFLTAKTERDFQTKRDALERAGWQMGRWGEGWMQRVVMFTKEEKENHETTL